MIRHVFGEVIARLEPRAARALLAVALLDGLASGSNAAGCFADRSAAVGSATEQ